MKDGSLGLVIIPTYNEIYNIERLSREIMAITSDVDVLIIDDNSPDGTGRMADVLSEENERIFALHRECKQGLASAYLMGFSWALARDYSYFIQMDADFSHQPRDLPNLITGLEKADVVIGSRLIKGGMIIGRPFYRNLLTKWGAIYTRKLLGFPVRDATAGFKAISKEMAEELDFASFRSKGYAFQIELLWQLKKAGARIIEVPIIFQERASGVSKMSWRIAIEAWTIVLRLRLSQQEMKVRSLFRLRP